jgi:hypothetical protein
VAIVLSQTREPTRLKLSAFAPNPRSLAVSARRPSSADAALDPPRESVLPREHG